MLNLTSCGFFWFGWRLPFIALFGLWQSWFDGEVEAWQAEPLGPCPCRRPIEDTCVVVASVHGVTELHRVWSWGVCLLGPLLQSSSWLSSLLGKF